MAEPKQRGAGPWVVTGGAVALAVVHTAFPDLEIDGVTLALLAVAALPWLAPLLTSIELPGGFKFQLREVQRKLEEKSQQVETLATRVDEVERFVQFAGTADQPLQDALDTALRRFHEYLVAAGAVLDSPPPRVEVGRTDANAEFYVPDNAFYDGARGCIVLGEQLADDPDVALREYTHHVLRSLAPSLAGTWDEGGMAAAVWSGIADYLPCSFKGDPHLAPAAARRAYGQPFIRDLTNRRSYPLPAEQLGPQQAGEVWGALFWDARALAGQAPADRAVLAAWVALGDASDHGDKAAPAAMLASLEQSLGAGVRPLFEQRGLARRRRAPSGG
ncbi:MAG TPA: hypothetical protein VFJ85_16195 [Acidimicrobiales bacterium]|nr:hypothetical protein [Acidimicrobiales bacterium]